MRLRPLGVVTVTSTLPALPDGETALIDLADMTRTSLAGALPKYTDAGTVKFAPVIATSVPPFGGPSLGESLLTVGGFRVANVRSEP